ncbi:RagB/SusD family nutrient uptake outer membrane protein [Paracnuella aquatica]|nr:RagB/SusD family nutrient uptake outer membrane protein [Paracnuella aquatica]
MFKTIKYSLMALTALSMLQACTKEEVLELTPEFTLDGLNNPSNMDQIEQVLLGAYAGFRNGNYYGSGSGTGAGWSLMPDVLSDNLFESGSSLANSRAMADWTFNQNTTQITTFYSAPYAVIANANVVLRDIDKFTTSANQGRANRLKGQALAIRALAHFDLFRYFAPRFDRNSNDPAVAYVKEFILPSPNAVQPPRMTNKEFYDNLFADLSEAVRLLQNVDRAINASSALTRPYIDLAGAYAIQARASLYAGQWADAITAATEAIDRRPLVNGVTNPAAFAGMYNETNRGEIIWNIQFEAGQSGPTFLVYFATNKRSYFRPALEIADTLGTGGLVRSNDVRYSTYFTHINDGTVSKGLALTKYRGKGATVSDGNANFPAIRTGEMYLIRAEARARSGQDVLALQDLNTLRANRITGNLPLVLVGAPLLEAIANERRAELIGEGHRFFDLKRTTRTIQRGSTCGTSQSPAGDCRLEPNDREWALPIPETVVRANTNQAQNSGY